MLPSWVSFSLPMTRVRRVSPGFDQALEIQIVPILDRLSVAAVMGAEAHRNALRLVQRQLTLISQQVQQCR